jgi:carboxymethylenebutenolidase
VSSRVESVITPDGPFDLTVWLPEAGHGPGILLIQEIFGVSDYIQAVAEDLAALGYVAAAPDLFWRLKPGHNAEHNEQGLNESLALGAQFDAEQGVADAAAALDRLAGLPEVEGGLGVIGFCLGGTIAFFLAARADLAAVVSFYGSGVPDQTEVLAQISAPIQFHFGGSDPYIPRDQVARVEATTPRSTSRKTPATPSTTASPPCSTSPRPPPAPGTAPRSSWPATSPCTRKPRPPDPPYPATPPLPFKDPDLAERAVVQPTAHHCAAREPGICVKGPVTRCVRTSPAAKQKAASPPSPGRRLVPRRWSPGSSQAPDDRWRRVAHGHRRRR